MNNKTVKLQHRTYLGTDKKTKYVQHRVNIPDSIIRRLGWNDAIKTIFKEVFGEESTIGPMLLYTIIVTIIAVILTIIVARAVANAKNK